MAMMLIELIITIIIKAKKDKIIKWFLTMQLLKTITIYYIFLPANLQLFIDELRKIVDFEAL